MKRIEILDTNPFGEQFIIYLGNRIKNPTAVWANIDNEVLQQEFIAKCQFMQHHARTKLGISNFSMEIAATMINNTKAVSFNKTVCGKLFDEFMHFIVVNEKNSVVLKSLMDTWVAQGRSLEELNESGLTPLSLAVATNNLPAFAALAQHGVDVTKIDSSGFSELHKLLDQIDKGTSDISMLKAWIDTGLPTDMAASEVTGRKYAGKTAVQIAQDKGLVAITRVLGGDVELAQANLEAVYEAQKDFIISKYQHKISSSPALTAIVGEDMKKLLLNYIVENMDQISPQVFERFLTDSSLGLKTNVVDQTGETPLELLVKAGALAGAEALKANQFALLLAKHGVGTITPDHGSTILSHTIKYGNANLFHSILDARLPIMDKPGKMIEISSAVSIADSPLANALLSGSIEMVVKVVKCGYINCTLNISGTIKECGVIESIRALGGPHKAALINLTSPYVNMKAEVIVQEMLNALLKNEKEFVKALVDNGADINHDFGAILKLLIDNKILPAIKLAIENGAKVTPDIKLIAVAKGIGSNIDGFVTEQDKVKMDMKHVSKMKLMLIKLLNNADDAEIASSFPDDADKLKYVEIAKNLRINKPAFKALCKANKVGTFATEEVKEAKHEEKKESKEPIVEVKEAKREEKREVKEPTGGASLLDHPGSHHSSTVDNPWSKASSPSDSGSTLTGEAVATELDLYD